MEYSKYKVGLQEQIQTLLITLNLTGLNSSHKRKTSGLG